jgi:hypothetical protein
VGKEELVYRAGQASGKLPTAILTGPMLACATPEPLQAQQERYGWVGVRRSAQGQAVTATRIPEARSRAQRSQEQAFGLALPMKVQQV